MSYASLPNVVEMLPPKTVEIDGNTIETPDGLMTLLTIKVLLIGVVFNTKVTNVVCTPITGLYVVAVAVEIENGYAVIVAVAIPPVTMPVTLIGKL